MNLTESKHVARIELCYDTFICEVNCHSIYATLYIVRSLDKNHEMNISLLYVSLFVLPNQTQNQPTLLLLYDDKENFELENYFIKTKMVIWLLLKFG